MKSPPIDNRNSKDIQEKIKQLIPYYLPNWNPKEGEPGWAVAQLFSEMQEDVIDRLNKVPENLFLDFLERLGFKLLPAVPSKAPVVFELVEKKKTNINIKKETRLSSADGVFFETEEDFTVTPAKLKKIYSVNPKTDLINEHITGIPSFLFSENKQKHYFYAGDEHLFNLYKAKGTGLTLYMFPPFEAVWEYFLGYDENGNEIWKKFKRVEKVFTRKPTEEEIKKAQKIRTQFEIAKKETEKLKLIKEYQELVKGLQVKKVYYDKTDGSPIHKKEINGINTYWIRARLEKNHQNLKTKNIFKIHGISGIDSLFYNDIPLSINDLLEGKTIQPFGTEPKVGDSFYISSDEAFSKRNGNITITFKFDLDSTFTKEKKQENPDSINLLNNEKPDLPKNKQTEKKPKISWEYWNGESWKSLNPSFELVEKSKTEIMNFTCPSDMSQIEVNGENHYWIRARLTGLSYGEYILEQDKVKPVFHPPEIKKIKIEFDIKATPKNSFSYNNLEYSEIKNEIHNPYQPIPDKNKTVYLGFDYPFGEGNINIFFSLLNPNWNEHKYLKWSYWNGNNWQEFPIKDRTENLKESGIFQFVAPSDIDKKSIFSNELYWLKLELIETKIKKEISKELIKTPKVHQQTESNQCIKVLDILGNLLKQKSAEEQIKLFGIYPNTVYAVQQQSIKNEILGSSDGSPNQIFKLKHTPVINAEIWIKEQTEPKEENVEFYKEKDYYWVLWEEIEDLDFSCENCRHYSLDRVSGEIKFGNGIKGKIPPRGKDNIKSNYKTGGGKKNLPIGAIKNLVSSIAYIDKVYNVEPASGGSEPEGQSEILERVPKTLRHRGKAVNLFDYENITREASTDIAKLKVIPKLDDKGDYQTGWITIVIFSFSEEKKPQVSKGLIKNVENYIKSKSPITTKIQVIPPVYGEISIDLSVSISDFSKFSEVKNSLEQKLTQFLDPLNGNVDGKGWDFGQIPCYSDFFTVINSIEGIESINNLQISLKVEEKSLSITSDKTTEIKVPPYLLIVPDELNIEIVGAKYATT